MGDVRICFNAIVKDEESIMLRRLNNIKHLCDAIAITDTGSSDATIKIIKDFGLKNNIPTRVDVCEFRNFAYARTQALDNAVKFVNTLQGKTWYLMFGDADDLNFGGSPEDNIDKSDDAKPLFPEIDRTTLGADTYQVIMSCSTARYIYTWMIKLVPGRIYHWVTPIHEYVCIKSDTSKVKPTPPGFIKGGYVDSRREGARSKDPQKYLRDALTFELAIRDVHQDKHRCTFYLAQSYRDAGLLEPSKKFYKERVSMFGFSEEVYVSYIELAKIRMRHGKLDSPHAIERIKIGLVDEKFVSYLLTAMNFNHLRLEAPYYLIRYYNTMNLFGSSLALIRSFKDSEWNIDFLFAENLIYDHLFFIEAFLACINTGNKLWRQFAQKIIDSKYANEKIKNEMAMHLRR
jgi:hypothetical protein